MVKDCRLKLELSKNEQGENIYSFILNENDEKVGFCGTKLNNDGTTEINYEIYSKYRGYGYSIEGIGYILNSLKESGKDVNLIAKVNEKNIGAWRVLERTGFSLKRVIFDKDENVMDRIYALDIRK